MLCWIQQPLPRGTAYAGTAIALRAVLPKLRAAASFLAIAGPILGVIVVKVLMFGGIAAAAAGVSSTAAAAHQILFSALCMLSLLSTCLPDELAYAHHDERHSSDRLPPPRPLLQTRVLYTRRCRPCSRW